MIPYRPAVYSNQRCGGYRSGDGICRYRPRTSTMAHVRPYIHIQHSRSLARRLLTGKRLRTHAAQSHTEHKHTPHNGCRRVRVHERARTQAHARIDPCESPGCDLATPPSVHERPIPPAHHAAGSSCRGSVRAGECDYNVGRPLTISAAEKGCADLLFCFKRGLPPGGQGGS